MPDFDHAHVWVLPPSYTSYDCTRCGSGDDVNACVIHTCTVRLCFKCRHNLPDQSSDE